MFEGPCKERWVMLTKYIGTQWVVRRCSCCSRTQYALIVPGKPPEWKNGNPPDM